MFPSIINVSSFRRPNDYPTIEMLGFEYFADLGSIAIVPLSYPYKYYIDLVNPTAEPKLAPYVSEIKEIVLNV